MPHFDSQTLVAGGDESNRVSNDLVLINSGKTTRNYATAQDGSRKLFRLVPDGMRLDGFNNNNMMLWMHNMIIPIGRLELFKNGGMLWGHKFNFHRKKIPLATQNWIGDAIGEFDTAVIADLWEEGFLRATSIHVIFQPEDVPNIWETETEVVFATSEVIEASIVTVPGDRESVKQQMLSHGIDRSIVGKLTNDEFLLNDAKKLYVPVNGLARKEPAALAGNTEIHTVEDTDMSGLADLDGTQDAIEEGFEEEDVVELDVELDYAEVELGEEEVIALAQQLAVSPAFVEAFVEALLSSPAADQVITRFVTKFGGLQASVKAPVAPKALKLRVGQPSNQPTAPAPFTVKTSKAVPAELKSAPADQQVSKFSRMVRVAN